MKRISAFGTIVSAFLVVHPGLTIAQSNRTTPAIEQLYTNALNAIEGERYIQATQILTRLISLPEHIHSAQAQELLGNVREANNQLAHAVAEYEIYLERYPDTEGATRVQARLEAILSGAQPQPPERPRAIATPASPRATPRRSPTAVRQAKPQRDPNEYTITDRGNVRLVFRYNTLNIEIEDLTAPSTTETTSDDSTATASLRFSRRMENASKKIDFLFNGNLGFELDGSDDPDFRLYDLSATHENKNSGRIVTFGRHRLKPSGVAYRTDGISVRFPMENGAEIGLFAGAVVNNTRDSFFSSDIYMIGGSATFKEAFQDGDLTVYAVEQRDGSRTDRRAVGLEYSRQMAAGSIYANLEYDAKFGAFNRVLFTGTRVLENNARLTGRISYQRSPSLSLQNALIGQTATSIDGLTGTYTENQIEDLARDRSGDVTTISATYYGQFNETWDLAVDGTLYYSGGTPASGGVSATSATGIQSYVGARFIGRSIFTDRDQVSLGARYSHTDSGDLVVGSASMRYPYDEQLTLRPRVQIGYRDNSGSGGTETFIIPSINARYKLDRETSFHMETGGELSRTKTSSQINTETSLFFSAGVSKSF